MKRLLSGIFAIILVAGVAAMSPRYFGYVHSVKNSAVALSVLPQSGDNVPQSDDNILKYEQAIDGIISAKKKEFNVSGDVIKSNEFASTAGGTAADWLAFSLARYNYTSDYSFYLGVADRYVTNLYKKEFALHRDKVTEWHRLSLTVAAAGANSRAFGEKSNASDKNILLANNANSQIDLAYDGTFNKSIADYERQGISGYIWSIITINALGIQEQAGAKVTKNELVEKVLSLEKIGGGFSLTGDVYDADMTAMALVAFSDTSNLTAGTKEKVAAAKERALGVLSEGQGQNGIYKSYGEENSPSTAWVALALDANGIDINDPRFVKNGINTIEALGSFKIENGGFSQSLGGNYDSKATEQVLYAYVAYWRAEKNMPKLFDLSPVEGNLIDPPVISSSDKLLAASYKDMNVKPEHYSSAARLYYLVRQSEDYPEKSEHLAIMKDALDKIEAQMNAPGKEKLDVGLLVGILLGILALSLVFVLGFRILRRKLKKNKPKSENPDDDDEEIDDNDENEKTYNGKDETAESDNIDEVK